MGSRSQSGKERRRHERYELLAQVHMKFGTEDYVLELGNLSRSGALLCFGSLRPPGWARLGKVLELGIINPETLDPVQLTAEIVRTHQDFAGPGFAVEFEEPDDAAAAGLRELIQLAGADEAEPPPLSQQCTSGPPSSPGELVSRPPPLPGERVSRPPPLPGQRVSRPPPLPQEPKTGPPSGRTKKP